MRSQGAELMIRSLRSLMAALRPTDPLPDAFQPRVKDVQDSTRASPAHQGNGAAAPPTAFTTLRLGGPAGRLVTATDEAAVRSTEI
jgi:hypothetical protein